MNAGDGWHEHPTQALLDIFTLNEKLGRIEGLNVSIIGDIAHSRVARSNIWGLTKLGARVTVCAPKKLIPAGIEKMGVSIEEVPDYRIKTTLQRSIQLLKRHRDIMFQDDPNDKPISIIITTLAALAYSNQADLYDALISIVGGMPSHIQILNGSSWIPNPVNPKENFADKWQENPQKELKFRSWLLKVQSDLEKASEKGDIHSF